MTIYPKCGVELDSGHATCPLCHTDMQNPDHGIGSKIPDYMRLDNPLTVKEKLHLFWELSGILHFSALLVTFLIDVILHGKPGWSWYVVAAIASSYFYITLIVFLTRRLILFLAGLLANTLALLWAIDYLNEGLSWFVLPGIPLAGFFVLLLGLVMLFIRHTRQRGFNVVAIISMAIGVYITLIEMSFAWTTATPVKLTWSIIVAISILPFSLFLLYFHYRLKRGTSLRKFFHL